jgi:hypothetical protein
MAKQNEVVDLLLVLVLVAVALGWVKGSLVDF